MRFHLPSFLHYLDQALPYNFACDHHHYMVYVITRFPVRFDFWQDTVLDTVLRTYETPLVTPSETESRSLIRSRRRS